MSNIPEHIMMVVRRYIAEGMPIEQIVFYTGISERIVKEEIEKQKGITQDEPSASREGEHSSR